jgi:RNA polymerase sigma-70 factor (ECF subfamily)
MIAVVPGPDDRELVERIAMGDENAFAIAYDRHSNLVFGSLVRFLGDRETAAEVAQDAFVALWRRADQFDAAAGSLAGWLLAIARNRAIDRLRSESRRREQPLAATASEPDRPPPSVRASVQTEASIERRVDPDPSRDPELVAGRRWQQALMRTAVSQLPEVERTVVVLAYSKGLSQAEIAEQIDAPIGTVKSRTRRAMARLRGQLADVPELFEGAVRMDAG